MSYNSVATFKLQAFPSGSYNNINEDVIQRKLNKAAGMLDNALSKHHKLPMNTSSYSEELAPLYEAEITIASYELMRFRGFKPNIEGTTDEVLREAYAEVIDPDIGFLAQLKRGDFTFPSETDATPNTSEGRTKIFGKSGRTSRQFDSNGDEYVGF